MWQSGNDLSKVIQEQCLTDEIRVTSVATDVSQIGRVVPVGALHSRGAFSIYAAAHTAYAVITRRTSSNIVD